MSRKKVSVILPTYGRSDEFRGALESISGQSYDNLEVVVVDDNPEDSSERKFILDSITQFSADIDILHIKRDSKGGLASARNKGIEESSGEYIAFLDDDDRWMEDKLEKQFKALEGNDFSASYTGRKLVSDSGPDHTVSPGKDVKELREILKENIIGTPSSVFVEKKFLDSVEGFAEDMDGAEEWDLWTRLVEEGCYFRSLEESLTIYKLDNDSMAGDSDIITPGREKYTEKFKEKIEQDNQTASSHYLKRGKEQFEFKNFQKSRNYLKKSLKYRKINLEVYLFLLSIWIEEKTGFDPIKPLVGIKHRF